MDDPEVRDFFDRMEGDLGIDDETLEEMTNRQYFATLFGYLEQRPTDGQFRVSNEGRQRISQIPRENKA